MSARAGVSTSSTPKQWRGRRASVRETRLPSTRHDVSPNDRFDRVKGKPRGAFAAAASSLARSPDVGRSVARTHPSKPPLDLCARAWDRLVGDVEGLARLEDAAASRLGTRLAHDPSPKEEGSLVFSGLRRRGRNLNPAFSVSGPLPSGWSSVPLSALGNFGETADADLSAGKLAYVLASAALKTPTQPSIKLQVLSAVASDCGPLQTESSPLGAAVPVTIAVAAANLNDGYDGIACGYVTFTPGTTNVLTLAVTDSRPVFSNWYEIKCANGKLSTR